MLESLSTEKNSLVYQLERLEQQLKTIQSPSTSGPSINMAGIDSSEGIHWHPKVRGWMCSVSEFAYGT